MRGKQIVARFVLVIFALIAASLLGWLAYESQAVRIVFGVMLLIWGSGWLLLWALGNA